MGSALDFLAEELARAEAAGLLRRLEPLASAQGPEIVLATGERLVNFSSNDYLALAADPRLAESARAALSRYGVGSGASRLVAGTHEEHERLERELAQLKGAQAALLFNSGYHGNVGVIPALVGDGDLIVSDALNHASVIDGARLSRARIEVTPHAEVEAVERALQRPARRKLVVTDALFSMDGDVAPLRELRACCDRSGAMLYVDEAHATGVLGARGAGACEAANVTPDIVLGTLGKALGTFGAFVAGPRVLRDHLVQRARSFVFTTALPVAVCAATRTALELLAHEPERRARALALAKRFSEGARARGLDVPTTDTQLVPFVRGEPAAAVEAARKLRAAGFFVQPIRPPTVPRGTSRLRFAFTAGHTEAQVDRLLACLAEIA